MPDKSLIIKEAQKYLSRGQIDRAIEEWEKLVRDCPDGNVYNTIGDLYLKKGDKRVAIDFYHKSADFFRKEGFSLKALALYKKIINLNISDSAALIALGELSEEKGLATDATKYYLAATDSLLKENRKNEIVEIYKRIINLSPTNIPLREKIAGLFLKEGLTHDALTEYLNIAKYYEEKDNLEQAKDYLNRAFEINPSDRDTLKRLADLMERSGVTSEAIKYLERLLDVCPDDSESLIKCAMLLKKSGKYEDALNYISKAIELEPSNIELYKLSGEIYLLLDDKPKAWDSFKRVVNTMIEEKRTDEALGIIEQFRDVAPLEIGRLQISLYRAKGDREREFQSLLFVADLLHDQGLGEEAIELYRDALRIHPDDPNLKRLLAEREVKPSETEEKTIEELLIDADIFIKYSLFDEARAILEELKVKDPMNIEVHRRLKSLYLDSGDKEQAVTECLILSEIFGRLGEMDKRDSFLKEAFEISPDDPRLKERMALLEEEKRPESLEDYAEELAEAEFYIRQGLQEDALRIYEKLLNIFPDNEDILSKVTTLQGMISLQPSRIEPEQVEPQTHETLDIEEIVEPQLDTEVLGIFEEFKKGLEKEVEPEDIETHYNLGIAYKEMGLLDDAIREFQTSRNEPRFYVQSMTMLGICYMEKGLYPIAIKAFKDALDNIEAKDESYWGALYDLALAHEKNGDLKIAFDLFTDIYGWNSKFRDVGDRLSQLKSAMEKEPPKKDRVSYL
ncbi:MAG: tetratricopeptide repeat protein [Thermodesulfovibrionales bacterium]